MGLEYMQARNLFMKDYGNAIIKLKGQKKPKWESTKAFLKIIKGKEKGNFFGVMVNTTQANGKMAKNQVVDTGNQSMGKSTWENGQMDKSTVMGFIQ